MGELPPRRAAVLGSPIAHSLSPVLHRAAYAELGLDWTYDAAEVTSATLPAFLDGLGPEWAGLSLTMPLKQAVLPLLDWVSAPATAVGAVNTVVLSPGRRLGTNTDVPGMVDVLAAGAPSAPRTAAVLGGGATAASALAALAELGVAEPLVVVRRPDASEGLRAAAQRLGVRPEIRGWDAGPDALGRDLVVSTVPGNAAAGLAGEVPQAAGVLLDVVYHPWPTALAAAWDAAGGTVVGGLDLLVAQAALQVVLMTGVDVPPGRLATVMRRAVSAGSEAPAT